MIRGEENVSRTFILLLIRLLGYCLELFFIILCGSLLCIDIKGVAASKLTTYSADFRLAGIQGR